MIKKHRLVLVAACALIDPENRFLLSRRPEGKFMAGLWEFPGGKIEDGETPEEAVSRELYEELGVTIQIKHLVPLVFASHTYDDFHLLMPFYICREFAGNPEAREGQDLQWIKDTNLADYPMPPADIPLVPALRSALGFL